MIDFRKLFVSHGDTPQIGDYVFKEAKTVLVCRYCYSPVDISKICKNGIPKYTCSKCGKERKPTLKQPTAIWMEYERRIEYRTLKEIIIDGISEKEA